MTSPYVFTRHASLQDTKYILVKKEQNAYSLFMRKIDATFPDELLRRILYTTQNIHSVELALPPLATIDA